MELQTLLTTEGAPEVKVSNVLERVVGLNLEFGRPGTTRKVQVKRDNGDAQGVLTRGINDNDLIRANKKILECPELQAIKAFDDATRATIMSWSLPTEFRGTIILPLSALSRTINFLKAREQGRLTLVDAFIGRYEFILADMERRLGVEFNRRHYKTLAKIESEFTMKWEPFAFSTPDGLQGEERQIFVETIQARGAVVADEMKRAMREMMAELVDHMADRLTVAPGEKPKVFRDTLVSNFTEFLDAFSGRNEALGDAELASLVDKARLLIGGVNPDTLRNSDIIRERVAKDIAEIKTALDSMIVARPTRKVKFDS